MAEIHVQAKKHERSSPMWIWIVVVVLIAAAVIYFLSTRNNNNNQNNTQNQTNTTSGVELPQRFAEVTYVIPNAV
jgi:flagellar basal body-associated protein FliL